MNTHIFVCIREMSRLQFHSAEYWDLTAELTTAADDINSSSSRAFTARLAAVDSVPVATAKDFDAATGELLATSKVRCVSC
jgi:DNA topoisomerase I